MHQTADFLLRHGYSVLFLSVMAEQIGLPIPAIPILLAMGALAGAGQILYAPALLLAVLASLLSDLLWYYLGRNRGSSILSLLCRISLEPDSCVRRTENVFVKYGPPGLLFAKFVPGLSTAAPPLAGMFRMKLLQFCLFDGGGALVWAGSYSLVGFIFRSQLEVLAERALGMGSWLLALAGGLLAAYILWKFIERRRFYHELRTSRISPEELKTLYDNGDSVLVVDLRSDLEWEDGIRLPGAIHLSFEDLDARQNEIPLDRDVVLYCT